MLKDKISICVSGIEYEHQLSERHADAVIA